MSTHESEIERIRAAYQQRDAQAPGSAATGWATPGYRYYMQQLEWDLLRMIDTGGVPLAGARVLEVGCGSGYFLHRFKEYGAAHAAGIDLMEERIAQARERYPTLELVAGDAGALPWAAGAFDITSHFTCLSSVLDPGVRARIAAEMWRVTRPGGMVLSFDMRPTPAPIRAIGRWRRGGATAATSTPTTPIDLAELRRLFPDGAIHHRVVSLNFELGALATRGRAIAQAAALLPFLRTHLLAVVCKPA